jgi:3-phenylpropionate/trans-cinnamate dioxygenase ferredoxin reductase component
MSAAPSQDRTVVIVGASAGGGAAAEALRKQGFDGRIVLLGDEPERPYERPPLSKEYLLGEVQASEFYLRPASWYEKNGVELLLNTCATRLDPATRQVELQDGRQLAYDQLVIATGAAPRHLHVPGGELDGVAYLRTLADATALRARILAAGRVVVVGMGFIGAEIAAACRTLKREVVVLEALAAPMIRALGEEVGDLLAAAHRARGVEVRLNEQVTEFRGHGRVEQVVSAADEAIDCELVVVGIGVIPNVDWLVGSGVALHNGVLVDELCRTNVPDVYAVGDVANWRSRRFGQHMRVEHYDNAGNQAKAAVRTMLGGAEPYDPVPYFWSDQHDLNLQYAGHTDGYDRVIFRGDPTATPANWSAFYIQDAELRAVLAVNRFKDLSAGRRLIANNVHVTTAQLQDEAFELKSLVK